MSTAIRSQLAVEVLSLGTAVFCPDCESISSSRSECPACGCRSVVNLARLLGGSLATDEPTKARQGQSVLFDATITVELPHMQAKDLEAAVEKLSMAIGSKFARDGVSLHVKVEPAIRKDTLSTLTGDLAL